MTKGAKGLFETERHRAMLPPHDDGRRGAAPMSARERVRRPKRDWDRASQINKARQDAPAERRRRQLEEEATRILAGEPVDVERIGRLNMTEAELRRFRQPGRGR